MGEKITLTLQDRAVRGKKVASLRREGVIPGVIYGSLKAKQPINVQVAVNVLEKVYRAAGHHSPVYLRLNDKPAIAMIKDLERNPVTGTPTHVSFHAVKSTDPVIAEVPIHLVGEGESEAERAGLIVLQTIEHLEVKALPANLPEALEVSVMSLKEAGDRLTVADIAVPENVEIVDNDDGRESNEDDEHSVMDLVVANVYEPSALQAANDAAGGDAEDVSDVESENGEPNSPSDDAAADRPGANGKEVPKLTNVDSK